MTFQETIDYVFNTAPLFQNLGGAAYKPGLSTTEILDSHYAHPHRAFKTIHVGGTNGKGSCAHTLAAVLQQAGYRVGLFTSPHLVDFRERIRVNGEMISKDYVVDFVERGKSFFEPLHPSFFELTTALAFNYFRDENVDVAVIEVGLGGRLDCTNIISPVLSVITNVSFDHMQILGNTLTDIAGEKAGIIKHGVPVVIGECCPETREVYLKKAGAVGAEIHFAQDEMEVLSSVETADFHRLYETRHWGQISGELSGLCQERNANTILCALNLLKENFNIDQENVAQGFGQVCELTGLRGRWEMMQEHPTVICDTGHNIGGWEYLAKQLSDNKYRHVHIVFGMAADKDIEAVLAILPRQATYYFAKASVKRAMDATLLLEKARRFLLNGDAYASVMEAYEAAMQVAGSDDLVYVGGSGFVVADFLRNQKI